MKRDPKRFPRAKIRGAEGKKIIADAISVFGAEALKADAKAFAQLMKHVKEIDENQSTVIMVQVENECGLLGDSRDRSRLAEAAWGQQVPHELLQKLKSEWSSLNKPFRDNFPALESIDTSTSKTWADIPAADPVFVEELFMAYHFAQYVETVASAGKAAYPLPLYTNVWQNYWGEDRDENTPNVVAGGGKPGDYPSGGGVTNVLDVWKLFAPSLALIAPDVYLNDYEASCQAYQHRGQAVLIPEQRRDEYGARRIWAAFGSHQCMGTAPFGIDTLPVEENPFRKHYGLLARVSRHVLDAQARGGASFGFFLDEVREDGTDHSLSIKTTFGDWDLLIERARVFGKPAAASGMIIHVTKDEFLLVGWGFQVSFASRDPRARFNGLLRFEEKDVVNASTGELRTLRLLNGDETISGRCAIMPSEDPEYGGFPIAITIPANTGIALVEPYALLEGDLDA